MCTYFDRKSAICLYVSSSKGGLDVFRFLGKGSMSRGILLRFWYNKLRLSVSRFPKAWSKCNKSSLTTVYSRHAVPLNKCSVCIDGFYEVVLLQ